MRRSEEFALCRVAGIPYLLPFGQGIADHRRGVQINETGAFLWELLKEELSDDELMTQFSAHYEIPLSESESVRTDINSFLNMLGCYGMLKRTTDQPPETGKHCGTVAYFLRIGGLVIKLCCPEQLLSRNFEAFTIPAPLKADQTVTITNYSPMSHPNGKILLRNSDLMVMECESLYVLLFPGTPGIKEAHLSKDGSNAVYYCHTPYAETLRQDIFHAVRLSFLYLAQLHHMTVLHSASIYYKGKAWLFSGHSGAGKSTHTNLWHRLFDTPLINGDLNLLSVETGKPAVHGLPWCGTSGISDSKSYPLGGIILLKQATEDRVELLSPHQAQLLVAQRLISPVWTEEQLRKNNDFIEEIAPHILICRLHCTQEPAAAETMRQTIDSYLDKNGEEA